jgi:hypothetical protein
MNGGNRVKGQAEVGKDAVEKVLLAQGKHRNYPFSPGCANLMGSSCG